jgi:intein/homing endonuclease
VARAAAPPFNGIVEQLLQKEGSRAGRRRKTICLDVEDLQKTEDVEKAETKELSLSRSLSGTLDQEKIHRLAFTADPAHVNTYASLYRPKRRLIPDYLLKRIAIQDDLVACIVQARQNQVSAFGRPRPDRHNTGFVIEPHQSVLEEIDKILDESARVAAKEELLRDIAAASKRVMTCGDPDAEAGEPLTFPQYLYESTRNAIVVGRIATEVCREEDVGGKPEFRCFRVADAGTIYRTAPQKSGGQEAADKLRRESLDLLEKLSQDGEVDKEKLDITKYADGEYAWVQVIEDRPVQAFTKEEMLVHNFYHVPDVELDGYPVTPLDTVLSAVTTHINITTHNKLYFQHGRAARGMLVIKSDDADDQIVGRIRQQFNASINSVSNCIDGSVRIFTDRGLRSIAEIVGSAKDVPIRIWTGKNWENGLAFKTGPRKLTETTLSNGVSLKTSPDHRYLVLVDGEGPVWKRQEELREGDFVCVNAKDVEGASEPLVFCGQEVGEDLMEVLGWMSADGCLTEGRLSLNYHHDREQDILEKHLAVLRKYNLNAHRETNYRTPEECERIKRKYGFKTVADRVTKIRCADAAFAKWLTDFGFYPSSIRKNVPARLYVLSPSMRAAYLRGLFSGDGNNAKRRSPSLTCSDANMRDEVRQLLLSLGIRTTFSEGKTKNSFVGSEREQVEAASYLSIKDRDAFFVKIGFLQDHKQPGFIKNPNRLAMQDRLPQAAARSLVRLAKDKKDLFSHREHADLDEILRGECVCSKPRVLRILKKAEIAPPSWLVDYHFETVVKIERTEQSVEMYDVSVYNKEHAFVGNGVVTHNSWRMPVFAVGPEEDITWQAIDAGGRDMEFQYLSDANARTILSAFQMAPEELPGWAYLSRGTNSQALSEANSEFKLEAARDLGIRPLLARFEDFINQNLMPLVAPKIAHKVSLKLVGLDAETPEKEDVRLTQAQQVHMTYDEVHQKVEKKPVGKRWAGEIPLNPLYKAYLDQYFTVGEIREHFMGVEGAAKDPLWDYVRDPFNAAHRQMLMQQQMAQQQAQQQAQAGGAPGGQPGAPGGPPPDQGGGDQGGEAAGPPDRERVQTEKQKADDDGQPGDLTRSIDQALEVLTKSEAELPVSRRRILARHKAFVDHQVNAFMADASRALKEVMGGVARTKKSKPSA